MKVVLIISLLFMPFLVACQVKETQSSGEESHVFSTKEWESFLSYFPDRKYNFLDSIQNLQIVKDTISNSLITTFLFSDSTDKKLSSGEIIKDIYIPISIYKGDDFIYPIGRSAYNGVHSYIKKNGGKCEFKFRNYPLGKIKLQNGNTLILFSYLQKAEDFYVVTAFIIDRDYNKIGHFGFLYSIDWEYCDYTMEDISKGSQLLSGITELLPSGFIIHDKMIGNYYEDTLEEQYWTVEIRDDGRFEIVKEKKIYEDGKIPLWSKNGYFIEDPDGYTNLRNKPSTKGKVMKRLLTKSKVEILDSSSEWWYVKDADGVEGFVHSSRIKG